MNDTQLYLTMGVPSFLVVLAWRSSSVQVNRLAGKIDRLAEQQQKAMTLRGYMIPLHERMAVI